MHSHCHFCTTSRAMPPLQCRLQQSVATAGGLAHCELLCDRSSSCITCEGRPLMPQHAALVVVAPCDVCGGSSSFFFAFAYAFTPSTCVSVVLFDMGFCVCRQCLLDGAPACIQHRLVMSAQLEELGWPARQPGKFELNSLTCFCWSVLYLQGHVQQV